MMIGIFCKNNRASRISIHSSKIQISKAAQIKTSGSSKRVKEKENHRRKHLSVTSAATVKLSKFDFFLFFPQPHKIAIEPRHMV